MNAPQELAQAFPFTSEAAAHQGHEGAGLLAEEYLDGPEVSVEVVSAAGHHTVVAITHKQLGPAPYFEETGHLVAPVLRTPATDAAGQAAIQALDALDLTHGVSHVEVRLTQHGPRIVEVNPRLGGDLIPHLVHLATGVDLVAAASDLAMGLLPDLRHNRHRAAAVGFLYPVAAGRVRALTMDPSLPVRAWCDRAVLEQRPGDQVAPPPDSGLDSRLAHVVVTADTPALCRRRMERALAAVHPEITTGETVAA